MKNNTFVHKYIKSLISKDDTVIDMTTGNGNDTLYLCSLANKVYGFDIQKEAIEKTRIKTKDYDNLILINDNHANIDKYINEKIRLAIFNLGYLPNSNSEIITDKESTLLAFKKTYDLLKDNGYIIITFYVGHVGGKDEFYYLDKYIKDNDLLILDFYKEQKNLLEPITYIIKKQNCIKKKS